jgi:hypothetical protein
MNETNENEAQQVTTQPRTTVPASEVRSGQRILLAPWAHTVARVVQGRHVRGKRHVHIEVVGGGRLVLEHDETVELLEVAS